MENNCCVPSEYNRLKDKKFLFAREEVCMPKVEVDQKNEISKRNSCSIKEEICSLAKEIVLKEKPFQFPKKELCDEKKEVDLHCTDTINEEERTIILRALNTLNPKSSKMFKYIESSVKQFITTLETKKCNIYDYTDCTFLPVCSQNSMDWRTFCNAIRPNCNPYLDYELAEFEKIIRDELNCQLACVETNNEESSSCSSDHSCCVVAISVDETSSQSPT